MGGIRNSESSSKSEKQEKKKRGEVADVGRRVILLKKNTKNGF